MQRDDTPYLLVDDDRLRRNIERLAEWAADHGLRVRPHAKTHKCAQVAARQLDAGATGLTVATIGEAEAFADAGFTDLFIAYPLWPSESKATRLRALADRAALRVGIDSVAGARQLAARLRGAPVDVVVEVDSGMRRTGVVPEEAGAVAAAARDAGLSVIGVFTFPGHGYGPGSARVDAARQELQALAAAAESLRRAGIEPRVVSGGSTPTVAFADGGVLTEVRPGVYPFNDAQQLELGSCDADRIALVAMATVVSVERPPTDPDSPITEPGSPLPDPSSPTPEPGSPIPEPRRRVVLDAGSKILGADRPGWASGFGRLLDHPEARIVSLSEHHAVVEFPGSGIPELGALVRVVPNHVCTAVNLADELIAETAHGLERWPVIARGANR
ncbi:MAG: alanine racemase [Gordonia sp. (in: high G+C Gram-positive bacteria)]|uniref:alanine racemase n=1 Tax=Gordonia sp. (in: high G+C Gram-positive bacteria) TaxID=84139 RepID=UPI0039E518B3